MTEVTEVGDEDESDDQDNNFMLTERNNNDHYPRDHLFASCNPNNQSLHLKHNGKSADISYSACKSARNLNYDFTDLTEKAIGKKIDNMKMYKETKL